MSEPSSPDLKLVFERLQELQNRLTSLEEKPAVSAPALDVQLGRQMLESQQLRSTLKRYEQQQTRVFETFSSGAAALTLQVGGILDQSFVPRLNGMFETAKDTVTKRLAQLDPEHFAGRTETELAGFESRFAESITRFSDLRDNLVKTELAILAATDRMDAIWADQGDASVGGWRLVMRSVARFVEQEKERAPDLRERFRGEANNTPSQPAIPEFACPKCRTMEVRRLQRQNLFQEALRLVAVAPYRCHECEHTFYSIGRG